MNKRKITHLQRARRAKRTRAKIFGEPKAPRLAVFRSNKNIAGQLIDDGEGKTLAAASLKDLTKEERKKNKTEQAMLVGALIAKRAAEKNIVRARFDRRSYRYHGRVRAFAEGARKGGLQL